MEGSQVLDNITLLKRINVVFKVSFVMINVEGETILKYVKISYLVRRKIVCPLETWYRLCEKMQ